MNLPKIKLLIADDHRILLDGLVQMLKDVPNIDIVSTASNGEQVLLKMSSYYVDVLLMDIQMPLLDGYETAKIVASKYKDTKILILSMHSEKIYIERMHSVGVHGYLLKSAGKDEIIEAIEKVYQGGKYFSADVTASILNQNLSDSNIDMSKSSTLTKREIEILKLISEGWKNPEIAEKLFLSVETIKTHRKNLMRKLDISNTAGLVKYTIDHLDGKTS